MYLRTYENLMEEIVVALKTQLKSQGNLLTGLLYSKVESAWHAKKKA